MEVLASRRVSDCQTACEEEAVVETPHETLAPPSTSVDDVVNDGEPVTACELHRISPTSYENDFATMVVPYVDAKTKAMGVRAELEELRKRSLTKKERTRGNF
jgi:hypothetical protein